MSDNKHAIQVSAIEPSGDHRPNSVLEPAHWAQLRANAESQLVREYREAFLLIYKVRGQMTGLAVDINSIETMLDGEVQGGQTSIIRMEPELIEEPATTKATDEPMAGPVPPAMTFTELARRFSKQMEQVVVSGKQITAASRQMTSGLRDLNEGVGMLQRKLSRVKY